MNTTSELFLYIIPSPYGIRWDSPRSLTLSAIVNQFSFKGRPIGHVHIELRQTSDGKINKTFTGMVQKSKSEERQLIFKDKIGLGVLFHSFKGRLEHSDEIATELTERMSKNQISFIHFKISNEAYERCMSYLSEFKANGFDQFYGLPNRPLYGEGAGCSAFGASFLEVAGLLFDEFTLGWTQKIRVPEKYLKNTFIVELLYGKNAKKWADQNEKSREIFFWDPDKIHSWIQNTHHHPFNSFQPEKINNNLGIFFDATKVDVPKTIPWKKQS